MLNSIIPHVYYENNSSLKKIKELEGLLVEGKIENWKENMGWR